VLTDPKLQSPDTSFLKGSMITDTIQTPMEFITNFDSENLPGSFTGNSIPIWSKRLIELFKSTGVDNLQCFDATLKSEDGNYIWNDYFAVNVLGQAAVADLSHSDYVKICESPSGLPFLGFQKLVLDKSKINDQLLFRLAENPIELLAHEQLITALQKTKQEGGWGITALPIDEI